VKPIMPIKTVTSTAAPAKRVRVRGRRKPVQVKRTVKEAVNEPEIQTPMPEFESAGVAEPTDFRITAEPVVVLEDTGGA